MAAPIGDECRVCGEATELLFGHDRFPIVRCRACGHQQCNVLPDVDHVHKQYGDDYFNGGGAGYSDYLGESRILTAHGRRYARLIRKYSEPGRMLDVGCAAGFIASAFAEDGWNVVGIDPNANMVRHARENLKLAAYEGGLEMFERIEGLSRPTDGFDLVSMIQVVAHFYDLSRALAKASALTRPGGFCLVETWNCASVTARLLGRSWHEYSPPTALHYFSRNSLNVAMARHRFEHIASGRPAKRIGVEHAVSLLRYKYGHGVLGRALCGALDRLPREMSLIYPAEDLFWSLFRRLPD